jgi:hypothetical protein
MHRSGTTHPPQDTSFKPSPPTICLQAYGTNTTADIPKALASFPGRKRLPGKKGLGGWGCLRNKFLKKEKDKIENCNQVGKGTDFLDQSFIHARPFAWS